MNLIQLAREGAKLQAVERVASPGFMGGTSGFFGALPGAGRNYREAAGDLTANAVVLMGLTWMVEKMNQSEMQVQSSTDGKDWRPSSSGRQNVLRPLIEPNPDYGTNVLLAGATVGAMVEGNGYWLLRRDNINRLAGFWYAPNRSVKLRSDIDASGVSTGGTRLIGCYEFTPLGGGSLVRLAPSDMGHFRGPLPNEGNPAMGMSRLGAVLREVVTDNEAATYAAAILQNMGIVPLVFSPDAKSEEDGSWTAERRKSLVERWREFRGEMAGMPMTMPVPMKITQIGMTPEQMVLDKVRTIPQRMICGAMNLSPDVLHIGDGKTKTFANAAEARESAVEDALLPHMAMIARTVTRIFRQERILGDGERIGWDLGVYRELQEDVDALHDRVRSNWDSGLYTLNQALIKLGDEKVPGGDFYKTDLATGSPSESDKQKKVKALQRRLWAGKEIDADPSQEA